TVGGVGGLSGGRLRRRPVVGAVGLLAVPVGVRQGRRVIISGGFDQTVRVWDLESGELALGPLTGHDDTVRAVAFGERFGQPVIVSGGYDGTVRVWDLESERYATLQIDLPHRV